MTKFKAGDRVRVINPPDWLQSETNIGPVVHISNTERYYVELDCQGQLGHYDFYAYELELVVESPFKPGARVKILTYGHSPEGVVEGVESNGIVYVRETNGSRTGFASRELELIVDKPAFKVGDRVEYTLRGKVNAVHSDGYINLTLNGEGWSLGPDDYNNLTKVTPPFPTTLGTLIKAKMRGQGDVVMFFTRGYDGWIRLMDNEFGYSDDELELISVEYEPKDE